MLATCSPRKGLSGISSLGFIHCDDSSYFDISFTFSSSFVRFIPFGGINYQKIIYLDRSNGVEAPCALYLRLNIDWWYFKINYDDDIDICDNYDNYEYNSNKNFFSITPSICQCVGIYIYMSRYSLIQWSSALISYDVMLLCLSLIPSVLSMWCCFSLT